MAFIQQNQHHGKNYDIYERELLAVCEGHTKTGDAPRMDTEPLPVTDHANLRSGSILEVKQTSGRWFARITRLYCLRSKHVTERSHYRS